MKLESILALERNAVRLGTIIGVLTKYGLADWLSGLDYKWLRNQFKSSDGQRLTDLKTAQRIRLALTELGVTFIKFGQMLSTRPDLVGPEIAEELAKLQSQMEQDAFEEIRAVFLNELGRDPHEIFAEFDDTPIASASIAQVHRAVLHTGEEVVVKVQHAHIEKQVAKDLDLMLGLAEIAEKHSSALRLYQPMATARQFSRTLRREMDFNHERRNLEQFATHFEYDDTVTFPEVFPHYCTKRILTMQYLRGIPGTDAQRMRESGQDLNEFARRGANMYLNMIFRDGFYHADPHPGNVMLLAGNVVGVMDCGMVGRLDDQLREEVENMLLAASEKDAQQLSEIVLRLGSTPIECNRDELRTDIGDFLVDFVGQSLADFDLSGALNGLTGIIRRHHIILPAPLSLLLKVLIMLEGTSQRLNREFSLAELMQPFYMQSTRRRLAPARVFKKLQKTFRDWERLLDSLPRDLSDIVSRIRSGTFHVHLEHKNIESTVNRLVIGILTAALFLGSSELWSRKAPPLLWGVSIFGLMGYLVSIWLGLRLLLAIRKSGNIRTEDDDS